MTILCHDNKIPKKFCLKKCENTLKKIYTIKTSKILLLNFGWCSDLLFSNCFALILLKISVKNVLGNNSALLDRK